MDSKKKAQEIVPSRFRQYPAPIAMALKVSVVLLVLFCLLYSSGIFAYAGLYLLAYQFNAIFLSGVVVFILLLIPATKNTPRKTLPWYDVVLIVASLAGNLYIAINALSLTYYTKLYATPIEIILGIFSLLTMMEAVRRSLDWAVCLIAVLFILYAKFGYLISGALSLHPLSWRWIVANVYLSTGGIFGSLATLASTVILIYITFGVFFAGIGGGRFFMNIAMTLVGGVRGGPAKAAIVGSALFGTISGSPAANATVTGIVTIPMMKQAGYKPIFAGAVEAVASTGGNIMPPIMAAVAFAMAELLNVSYSRVALAAVIPAILYFMALYAQVDLRAAKEGLRGAPRDQFPPISVTLKRGWQFIIPFFVLVVFLFVLRYDAPTSGLYAIIALVAVGMTQKDTRSKLTPKLLARYLEEGFYSTMPIAALIGVAGVFMAILTVTGLGPEISSAIVAIAGDNLPLLAILVAVVCYILGMGVSALASYILLAILAAPAMAHMGVPPMAAHFFVMYMGLSTFFTPPYCPAVFVTAAIAKAPPYQTGLAAMRLGIACFIVPFILIFNPALVLVGTPVEIVLAATMGIISIVAISAAIEGYLLRELNWLQRTMFSVGAIVLLVPGLVTWLSGMGILGIGVGWHLVTSRGDRELKPV